MLGLSYFSFAELWSPWFFFLMAAITIGYYYVVGPWRERHYPDEPTVTAKQKFWFTSAAVLLYLAHGGPLQLFGHLMFTFHMLNMSLSYLLVPPMLLLGIPAFVWRFVFDRPFWRKLRWLMHPLLTLLLFNMLFSLYHVPVVHDYVMTQFTVHRLYYIALLITAVMMWWQVLCPVKEWNRISHVKKMGYVFANGVLLTPACALIIFASTPLYATYSDPAVWAQAMGYCVSGDPATLLAQFSGPAYFNFLPIMDDQQLGGILMKLVQEITYGFVLATIFVQWFRKEHHENENDEILPSGSAGAM